VSALVGERQQRIQDALPLGLKLVEGILAVGSSPAAGGGIERAGATLGFNNEDVAVGALDHEVALAPNAAIVLVGESPADAEFGPEHGEKRGHGLLALGAGIRRCGVNPAGHLFEGGRQKFEGGKMVDFRCWILDFGFNSEFKIYHFLLPLGIFGGGFDDRGEDFLNALDLLEKGF
jgi:hypothetical protein